MKLGALKTTKFTNIIMAAVATLAIAGYQKELGFMNLALTFMVAFFLLSLVDIFKKFADTKLSKKLVQKGRSNR